MSTPNDDCHGENAMTNPSEDGDPSIQHGPVPTDWECLVTMEDITDDNYVEYQSMPSGLWRPAKIEQSVVEHLLRTQFDDYVTKVRQSDCQAELRRLLASGPPRYISDPHGLPVPESETHIAQLWYASDQQTRSARLPNAVTGVERERLWDELRAFAPSDARDNDADTKNDTVVSLDTTTTIEHQE
jgi:hypothetical protein